MWLILTFFSSSESVKFFIIVHRVTSNVSSFSERMELFPDFHHIFVGPSDVIPLAVSDVHPLRKLIYLFILFLGVLPIEIVALHLPEMHDETHIQITICNDYFFVYPHIIL